MPSPWTIDPGYRGEGRVLMINLSREAYLIKPGERVAQLVIGAYAAPEWEWSETLDDSQRSVGGFGSTGA